MVAVIFETVTAMVPQCRGIATKMTESDQRLYGECMMAIAPGIFKDGEPVAPIPVEKMPVSHFGSKPP